VIKGDISTTLVEAESFNNGNDDDFDVASLVTTGLVILIEA
jgi:hypothetical protein